MTNSAKSDLSAGTAAEHLVCADLILSGFHAFMSDQNCSYDVVAEIPGRLIRIQVKSTRQPRSIPQRVGNYPAYMWHVRRAGKRNCRVYGKDEFDVLALVALDCRKIAYVLPEHQKQTFHIRTFEEDDARNLGKKVGKTFEQYSLPKAIQGLVL